MTQEHLPARSAGNSATIKEAPLPGTTVEPAALRSWDDGLTVPNLCEACNQNGTKWRFVDEYKHWRESGLESLRRYCRREQRLNPGRLIPGELIELQLGYDRMPGRFARYVVSMFLAAQQNERLVAEHPQLLNAVAPSPTGGPPGACDISPARLLLAFANQNTFVMTDSMLELTLDLGGKTRSGLHVPPGSSSATDLRMLVFTPFAFTLVASGPTPKGAGLEISSWTQFEHGQRLRKSLLRLDIPALGMNMPPRV